jgi:death-on-curing protein
LPIRFIDEGGVLEINRVETRKTGEDCIVIKKGSLCYCVDSAIDFETPNREVLCACIKAAAFYMWCIACNHVFLAGNKRTAYQVAYVFLFANGYVLTGVRNEEVVPLMNGITLGTFDREYVEKWIREHIKPISM